MFPHADRPPGVFPTWLALPQSADRAIAVEGPVFVDAATKQVPPLPLAEFTPRYEGLGSAPPQVRQGSLEVAKLIDVSKCIGCKACQSACLAWNDLVEPVGFLDGSYNNPPDLTPTSWTVMKFTEYEKGDDLELLIRKLHP